MPPKAKAKAKARAKGACLACFPLSRNVSLVLGSENWVWFGVWGGGLPSSLVGAEAAKWTKLIEEGEVTRNRCREE